MKGCSQFLTLFILAGVVGFLIYSQSQIVQMKRQVEEISGKFKVGSKASSEGSDIVTPIVGAKKHALQAKALLKKGNRAAAEAELDEVIKNLNAADKASLDIVGEIGAIAGKAGGKLTDAYKQAVKDISTQMKMQQDTGGDSEKK